MERRIRGRCALCRCRAKAEVYGIRVCPYHVDHGESDRPCPYCLTSPLYDPRWTYTIHGEPLPKKVQVRQMHLPNTIFLDANGEIVLDIESVREPRVGGGNRHSVVMVGVGLQMGTTFTITQWASDWERDLLDAVRPTLALAHRIFITSRMNRDVEILAGTWMAKTAPTWPVMDVRTKTLNVHPFLRDQTIPPNNRPSIDIAEEDVPRRWNANDREPVWRHNYLDVLDSAMRIFQIEWPPAEQEYSNAH